MKVQDIDWLAVAPPLVLAGAAIVVLLLDAFFGPARTRNQAHLPAVLTVAALIGSAVTAGAMWDDAARSTFCIERPLEGPLGCSFVVDRFTLVFWAITLFGTAVVALLGTVAIADGRTPQGEWNFLLLSSATGALVIAASRDLVTLIVALEVVSLPAFAMAGLRHGDRRAAEASLKFFLVSVISTAVMLMGLSLVYGATGTVFFDQLNATLAVVDDTRTVAVAGALLTVVGLAFKVAAVPFHMWVPDTYVGAPVAVAAYLSVVSKAAGFVGLMLVLTYALPTFADEWSPVIAVLAALTMTVGNVLALRQTHAVRLLAWSSVAQAGYILVPFGAVSGSSVGREVLGASIGYLGIYAVINLGAFAVAALVGTRHHAQQLEDYRGLVRGEPGAGWALAFALVALAGLPPGVVGLVAKVVVLDVAAGPATWLAVVMAVNVAIGLVYYARWLMVLFTPADDGQASRYDVPNAVAVAIGVTLTAGLTFSIFPGWIVDNAITVLG
ncbi:MAG TPA: NADH-quinone oxidoreductase subunit N [Nocardioidaceae bacterium]|nr:NADH-quinone oxidoreductase subunit N [Nocardioidaceae bacterium]